MSDNGPCFVSQEFGAFAAENGIYHNLVAPYAPQSNGLAERNVRIFKNLWDKFTQGSVNSRMARLLYHQRANVQSTTNQAPAFLMFGRNFRSNLDFLEIKKKQVVKPLDSKFAVGDAVFAKNFGQGADWIGGKIVEVLNSTNYKVQLSTEDKIVWKRHVSQIFRREKLDARSEDPQKVLRFSMTPVENIEEPTLIAATPQTSEGVITRSGRISRPPDRLNL